MTVGRPSKQVMESYFEQQALSGFRMTSRKGQPLERWEYGLGGIEDVPYARLFRRNSVFIAYCHNPFLLNDAVLPSGGGFGTFAFDGSVVRYMHREEPGDVDAVLASEGPALFENEAAALAAFFADSLLSDRNHHHVVLASHAALAEQYGLVKERFAALEETVRPAEIKGNASEGWELSFFSLYGWMHATTTLRNEVVRISSSFRATLHGRDVAADLVTPLDVIY